MNSATDGRTTLANLTTETIEVRTTRVGCDGTGSGASGPLGHPLVYLNLGATGVVDCPYCGRRYRLAAGALAGAAH